MPRIVLSIAIAVALAGCASMMSGGRDQVTVAATAPGAQIYVDDVYAGPAPRVIQLDRARSAGRVVLVAPGYHPALVVVPRHISGWFLASMLMAGAFGMAADVMLGNERAFADDDLLVEMIPVGGPCGPCPAPLALAPR
jgi:uncharacterized protein YceK